MKAFFYPHGGSGNHGCEAIVRTTKNILAKADPRYEFILCTDDVQQDIRYGISGFEFVQSNTINRLSAESIAEKFINKYFHKYSRATMLRVKDIANNIQAKSLCLSIGGDCYSYKDYIPYKILCLNDIAKDKNCNLVYWGCSIGSDCITKFIIPDLKKYHLISARESITYEALINAGINRNTHIFPDPAFTLESSRLTLPNGFTPDNTIGLNISPMIQAFDGGDNVAYNNYRALITYIINKTDHQIALIPHVVWSANNDLLPIKSLYDEFERTGRVVLIGDHNCLELKGFISRCRAFIGARTHATIAAYSTCVPTLVVGYSVKAKGIAKDIFGTYEGYVLPVQSLKSDNELTEGFKWLMGHENEIRAHLHSVMPEYILRAWQAGDEVRKLVEARS